MKTSKTKISTQKLALGAILTALVILLQILGSFIRFGPFSISLVLVPVVIGAATCGTGISTWLGFVFGLAVLFSGDAGAFLAVHVPGTIATVLIKGTGAGLAAGLSYSAVMALLDSRSVRQVGRIRDAYGLCAQCEPGVKRYLSRNNRYYAVLIAALICPLVNTGIFLLGCLVFFMETVQSWAAAASLGENVARYMILVLVGANFLFELASNVILSPIATRIVRIREKNH